MWFVNTFFKKNCTIRKTLTQIKPIMLDKFKGLGWKKYYLIFGMCDETFSVNYTSEIPEDVDRGWFYFFVTLLNQFYWVASATIGGIIGSLLKFDTSGISFVMTAMFVVIFLDQWMKEKIHVSSMIGILVSLVCLILFGADSFMIPTMILIVLLLTVLRKWLEQWQRAIFLSLFLKKIKRHRNISGILVNFFLLLFSEC